MKMFRKYLATAAKSIVAVMAIAGSASAMPAMQQQSVEADSLYRQGRSLLSDSRFESAARTFALIRENHRSSTRAGDSYYWEAFALYRLGDGAEALQLLEEQQRDHSDARTSRDGRSLMSRICGDRAGDERCARVVAEQSRADSDVSDETRMMALNALMNMRPERALPVLRRFVTNYDRSPELRVQALYMLVDKAGPAEATELLISIANDDPHREVRRQAVFWLSEVDSEEAVDALLSFAQESGDEELLLQAVFALSQHDSPRAMNAVRAMAADAEIPINVRRQAVYWMGSEGNDSDIRALKAMYPDVRDREVRTAIVHAVAEAGGRENREWLLQLALDEDEPIEVRKNAMYFIGEAGASVPQLIDLYDSTFETEMRTQLIWVLAETGEETAVDKLLDIARNDPEIRLREQAIFWLGESDDPRAIDFLLELIDG